MSPPESAVRLERIKELLQQAQSLPEIERSAYLDAVCGDDRALRNELDSLLEHAAETAFLGASMPEVWAEREMGEIDLRIGPYRLLERLGSGGMGTVWLAVRDEAGFSLRVALKLLRKSPDRERLVPRFLRERRILADLEHPGIARLLDGGTSEDGFPYLVLEYVQGTPLDVYARGLRFDQRLALLASIADAVQAAHERGIVHRDLKPSNILVTREGSPKLLDFGIAKICEEDELALTELTGTGERLLTPRYAAPEQLRGEAVSSATDVYALGVLLYELTTGTSPYGATTTRRELESAILEGPLQPPSRTLRGAERRRLRGDIDVIVLRAMAREPARRYACAGEFASDLRRHLAREPIRARRDTRAYRASKFVERNRTLVIATALAFLSLATGLVVALRESANARRALRGAERNAYVAALTGAEAALRDSQTASARAQLERAPEELRGIEWRFLRARLDRSSAERSFGEPLWCTDMDARGERLVALGSTHAWIVDAPTLEVRAEIELPPLGSYRCAALLDDGAALFGGTNLEGGGFALLVEPANSAAPRVALSRAAAVTCAIALDAERVAIGDIRGAIAVYSRRDFAELAAVDAHTEEIMDLAVHRERGLLASASFDSKAKLFALEDLAPRGVLEGHTTAISSCAFDPKGERLATGALDLSARVWNLADARCLSISHAHQRGVSVVAFDAEGRWLLSGSRGQLLATEPLNGRLRTSLPGPTDVVRSLHVLADGALLCADEKLRRFEPNAQEVWRRLACEFTNSVHFLGEERLLVAGPDGFLHWWTRGDRRSRRVGPAPSPQDLVGVELTPDRRFAIGYHDASPRLSFFDLERGTWVRSLEIERSARAIAATDREFLALVQPTRLLRFEAATGDPLDEIALPEGYYQHVAVEPHRRIALIAGSPALRVDLDTRQIEALPGAFEATDKVRIAPDGSRAAFLSSAAILVLDLKTYTLQAKISLAHLRTHHRDVAFHPDGTRLVSAHSDGTLRFFDTQSWEEIVAFSAGGEQIQALRFSPSGEALGFACYDGSVLWWDAAPL